MRPRARLQPGALFVLAQLAAQIERLPYKPPFTIALVVRLSLCPALFNAKFFTAITLLPSPLALLQLLMLPYCLTC